MAAVIHVSSGLANLLRAIVRERNPDSAHAVDELLGGGSVDHATRLVLCDAVSEEMAATAFEGESFLLLERLIDALDPSNEDDVTWHVRLTDKQSRGGP
jgi:hypothetical protein